MAVAKLLLCVCLIFQGSRSFDWDNTSPADGLVFYICQGATVTVSWQYVLSAGETIGEITWLYNGRSQEMIALQSHGQFVVLPAFSHRVVASGNAGIVLTHVMTGDSGNYSVEVQVFRDSGSAHVLMRQTVVLDVTNMLMTTDGVLHATQMLEPVQDPQTGQWGIRLQCGKFIFPDNPPFNVEWLSPEGNAMNSTNFHDHYFLLDLPQPIKGGNYTCRITPQNAGKACLHGNNTHQGEATAFVDKIDAQLSILLKENQAMKQQQIHLALENQQLEVRLNMTNDELAITKNELSQTNAELTQAKTDMALGNQQLEIQLNQTKSEVNISKNELTQTNSKLSQTNAELSQTKNELSQTKNELSQAKTQLSSADTSLSNRLQRLEDAARHQVAFHATGLQSRDPPQGTPLIFNHVVYNQGNAYNANTGLFVAPYPGVYYFIGTTASYNAQSVVYFYLYVDNTQITASLSYWNGAFHQEIYSSVHGVVHLNAGQRVYISGSQGFDPTENFSKFSGFLLYHDFA